MYRLLALDLDGTVVTRERRITEPVRRAVAEAQAAGVYVTVATGRVFRTALPFARELGLGGALICCQGAVIREAHTRDLVHHTPLPPALAAEAITLLHRPGLCVMAYIDDTLCLVEDGEGFDGFVRRWGAPDPRHVRVSPALAEQALATPPTKVMFFGDPSVIDREFVRVAAHFESRLTVVRSDPTIGELTAPGSSKGVALAALAARLSLAPGEVIAIGDEENDVPMLRWAGLGLAMGNAPAVVQRAANAVIPSVDEDGVAWAIEEHILRGMR